MTTEQTTPTEGIRIGPWIVKPSHPGKVWIERADDSEGMQCDEALFAEWVGQFYEKHF
jgi:hypothetical protein